MMYVTEILLVTVAFIASTHCATLISSHQEIEAFKSSNVALECRLSEANSSDFYTISTIRILKFNSDMEKWRPVVEMWTSDGNPRVLDGMNFTAVGDVSAGSNPPEQNSNDTRSDDHLKISWNLANNETAGRYRCDIIGSSEDYAVIWEKSPIVDIVERPDLTANEVHDILIQQKANLETEMKEQKSEIESGIMKKLREAAAIKYNETKIWREHMEQKLSDMKEIQLLLLTGFLEYWPEGVYGLAQPTTGCPANIGVTWQTGGYRRHHTESISRNYDEISTINHFYGGVLSRSGTSNYMFQYFCMVTSQSVGPLWPKGSYCIARYTGTCPEGFSTGYVFWQDEDSECSNSGNVPNGNYHNYDTYIYYCCRSDGPVDTPIYLPKTKPFYLYRYEGTCQSVVGMSVTEEYMLFDTDGSNSVSGYHPDVDIYPHLKLHFCYYEGN